MKKLTAEWCRNRIESMKANGLSLLEEKYLQALEIALPVLEQNDRQRQKCGGKVMAKSNKNQQENKND